MSIFPKGKVYGAFIQNYFFWFRDSILVFLLWAKIFVFACVFEIAFRSSCTKIFHIPVPLFLFCVVFVLRLDHVGPNHFLTHYLFLVLFSYCNSIVSYQMFLYAVDLAWIFSPELTNTFGPNDIVFCCCSTPRQRVSCLLLFRLCRVVSRRAGAYRLLLKYNLCLGVALHNCLSINYEHF